MRRAGNVQNVIGRSGPIARASLSPSGDRIVCDVAGIDRGEVRADRGRDFLRHPRSTTKIGGPHSPREVLSVRRAGQDAARAAVAGGGRPFFSLAASTSFVGRSSAFGASRVRDLFTPAKEAAPSIVFIDELE